LSLKTLPEEIRLATEAFIKKYDPSLTVDNFHPRGLKFEDELGQTVVIVPCNLMRGLVEFTTANADVYVLVCDSKIIGWVNESFVAGSSSVALPLGSLNKMPKSLKFSTPCPHLAYFGGVKIGDGYFRCLGCGQDIA
jgi:hypothetical protein